MIPRPPISLDPVFDDPAEVAGLFARLAPYPMLQARAQVMGSHLEQAAITGDEITDEMVRAAAAGGSLTLQLTPTFRGYWATPENVSPGVDALFHYERFLAAARRLHGAEVVRPTEIYAHVIAPHRVIPKGSHLDLPAFRGVGRRQLPTWLLVTMRRSGLFDRWRIPVATAVCWLYRGPGGTFTYWPEGPAKPHATTRHPFDNTAVVGENDSMFHRGDAVGTGNRAIPEELSVDCQLGPAAGSGDIWEIRDGATTIARYERREIRFALSWSAQVFHDVEAARVADEHEDDLDVDTIVDIFRRDLDARGVAVSRPASHADPHWIATLGRVYRIVPQCDPGSEAR